MPIGRIGKNEVSTAVRRQTSKLDGPKATPTYYVNAAGQLVLVERSGRAYGFEGGSWHRADHLAIAPITQAAAEKRFPQAFALDVAPL